MSADIDTQLKAGNQTANRNYVTNDMNLRLDFLLHHTYVHQQLFFSGRVLHPHVWTSVPDDLQLRALRACWGVVP